VTPSRRDLLAGAVAGAFAAACGSGRRGPRVISDVGRLPEQLRALETAMREHGYLVDQGLRPAGAGLADLPEELRVLHRWHDGQPENASFPLFRDMYLLAADAIAGHVESARILTGRDDLVPFAGYEGFDYTVPREAWTYDRRFERPVVAIGEGVEIYFLSVGHLVETQRAWIESGVHRPRDSRVDETREREIWRRINPGLF